MQNDNARKKDAEILASLRRRSADDPSQATNGERATTETQERSESQNRADALRRLRDSKGPTSPMSAVSPTLRGLREEQEDNFATPTLPEQSVVDESVGALKPTAKIVRDLESDDAIESEIMIVSELYKGYVMGKKKVPVLRGVNLSAHKGEFLAVVGQSGSGKSTLLHLMGTLDVPDSGTIYFDGQRINNLTIGQRDVLRNHFIGMIFQFYHLLPELTVLENVLSPLMIRDGVFNYMRRRRRYVQEASDLLELVGLSHRLKHRPNELSGGEMQRASIARALISNPRLLLADEPTGNLDSKASASVLELLRKLNDEKKLTVVMVTHDMAQARDADRSIRIVDGQVVDESRYS